MTDDRVLDENARLREDLRHADEAYARVAAQRDRLGEENEEYDELLRVAWNQRDALLAALKEISQRPNEHYCIVSERLIAIARDAIAEVEGEKP